MDARAAVHAEIDRLSDEQVEEVARKIVEVRQAPFPEKSLSVLEQLLEIQIDAPADLSDKILRARHGDFGGQ